MRRRGSIPVALALTASIALSCSAASGPADVKAEIQALFTRQTNALARGDRAAYDKTNDQERKAYRRAQAAYFDRATQGEGLGTPPRVVKVEALHGGLEGLWRAYVSIDVEQSFGFASDPHVIRRYVRRAAGEWILTEPDAGQTGIERRRELDGATLIYWSIDDDIADMLAKEVTRAHTRALRSGVAPFRSAISVTFAPTMEILGPGWDPLIVSTFGDKSHKHAPVTLGLDESLTSISPATTSLMTIAFASSLREQTLGLGRISARLVDVGWLVDGWNTFAGGVSPQSDFFAPVCAGVAPPTLKQLSTSGATPNAQFATYGFQRSMIEALYERYGPMAYWELLEAFRDDPRSSVAFAKVLRTTPDGFYADWLVWARKKYC